MIKLIDDWAITADSMCFVLGQMVTRKNKKGETKTELANTSYHPTLRNAVRACYTRFALQAVKDMDGTLDDAVQALTALQQRFERILADTLGRFEELNTPQSEENAL
jgi:hypothetical protein